ncbi:RNA polymerase sigma-70 factor (ECF subfamily) [Asticcacaulis solisilvae]|nr:RNA polymerase sigma-70 factor (ECF subfamily) [Asticcacaulis solisilvae]MDR6802191.1 RNA polymerase sigma-70 factor (ECF subfamily) [Asticcacaulis sp. BE141]
MLDKARRAIARKGVLAQDVDDLVQEAYLKVLEYEQRAVVQSTEALLVSSAVNLFYDKVRRRRYSPLVEVRTEVTGVDSAPRADDILRDQARLRRTIEGLDQLPEKTRRILISRRLDGKSYKEIAEAEGMTVSAVHKQVVRATLDLKKWIDEW